MAGRKTTNKEKIEKAKKELETLSAILGKIFHLYQGCKMRRRLRFFQRVFCRISISELLRRKLERMGRMCLRFGLVNVFFYRHSN